MCFIISIRLIPAFHHHFGRQCRVADYGFTKLPDLLAALSNAIVVSSLYSLLFNIPLIIGLFLLHFVRHSTYIYLFAVMKSSHLKDLIDSRLNFHLI